MSATREGLIDELASRREAMTRRYLELLLSGDGVSGDDRRLADLVDAAERTLDFVIEGARGDSPSTEQVLTFGRPFVRRAMLRGVTPADIQVAARHVLRLVWDALAEISGDDRRKRAELVELMPIVMDLVDVIGGAAATAMREAEEARAASSLAAETEAVDAIISGRAHVEPAAAAIVKRCGIGEAATLVIVVARTSVSAGDRIALPFATSTLRKATSGSHPALATLRGDHVVLVSAVGDDDGQALADRLVSARDRLLQDGIDVQLGGSAFHEGTAAGADAYAEALTALERVEPERGVLLLWTLTAFDYLLLSVKDQTAWRLVPPRIRRFVTDDLERSGPLVPTVMAYLESGLQVTAAAERLFVHRGTAQYRLRRVEQLTGCDLRDVGQLQEILVAVRLAQADGRTESRASGRASPARP